MGGVAGSDAQVPAAPEAPSPANRGPELGAEVGGRAGESALFPRDAGQWVGKGHMGPGAPQVSPATHSGAGVRLPAPLGEWVPPSPPHPPWWVSSKANSSVHGRGQRPRPADPAAHSLLPRRRCEGGRWQAQWTSKSQIHSLKGEKKAKNQKKKILMTEQCANDEAPPPRQGGGGRA